MGQLLAKLLIETRTYWHEHVAFQSVGVWLVDWQNEVTGHYEYPYFTFFFSVATFSHRRSARIKKLI